MFSNQNSRRIPSRTVTLVCLACVMLVNGARMIAQGLNEMYPKQKPAAVQAARPLADR
jgi:hypothetical protein